MEPRVKPFLFDLNFMSAKNSQDTSVLESDMLENILNKAF